MPKISLPTIESGYLSTEALNQAFSDITTAINNTLSRDGSSPNQLEADLDLNGHALLNVGSDITDDTSLLTVGDMKDYVDSRASGLVSQRTETQTATASQKVFMLTTMTYAPSSHNLAVYVNGVRKFSPTDYTENNETTITFQSGLTNGDKVMFLTNDYVATIDLPDHSHTWADLTNVPDYASRWPTWDEVAGKPATFTPATHTHAASDITSGRLADARRGVWVQASQPSSPTTGDLWIW